MKHLFTAWTSLQRRLKKAPHIFLFLDYDGTLTPLVNDPFRASLPAPVRNLLRDLSERRSLSLALVSGRTVKQLKRWVRLPHLLYIGNHGLEGDVPGQGYRAHTQVSQENDRLLQGLKGWFQKYLCPIPGVVLEDKGLALTLHYRRVKEKDVPRVRSLVRQAHRQVSSRFRLGRGKKILEFLPLSNYNKGTAVSACLTHRKRSGRTLPIYIGDDRTDEDAFHVIQKKKGMTIFVQGEKKVSRYADYYLRNPAEVRQFLHRLRLTLRV